MDGLDISARVHDLPCRGLQGIEFDYDTTLDAICFVAFVPEPISIGGWIFEMKQDGPVRKREALVRGFAPRPRQILRRGVGGP